MQITRTRTGLRLSQHGVVISELRTSPGPTHSVFDVLAALIAILPPAKRIGVLGFAGGGMMAPLRALGVETTIETVDLDRSAYTAFCRHCPEWIQHVNWQHADAAKWLRQQRGKFDLLIEDLSVPLGGDVVKPDISWNVLPGLIRKRLCRGGAAIFNLMLPPGGRWNPDLNRLAAGFQSACVVDFDEFENRILIGGDHLPSARELGLRLRRSLSQLGSRQADRIHVRQLLRNRC